MNPDPVPPTDANLPVPNSAVVAGPVSDSPGPESPVSDWPGDDSEITVVSKKPPQQFCTSAFDWRKVGELLIGKQLGSFRLDALLGVGGMGAVFRATDLQLDREVAVKVLNSADNDPEAERRFRIEAQSAARLDHQNIARVFHVGQDQGWNYIVLELVAGQTLRQWVASRGPLDLKTAVHFFRQLAAALDHAHQRNIIHRDIKPSNVLVAEDLTVKIVDMGLARIQKSKESADHEAEAGMTLGTFDYLAPEQARDPRQADQQSDLYSLGCTLYFALVGRPPFADATSLEKLLSHSNSARPRVTTARPDLPPSVDRLVAALMAPRKVDRVATAKDFERMLLNLRTDARPTLRSIAAPSVSQRGSWQRLVLLSGAMTVLLVTLSMLFEGRWRDPGIQLPDWPVVETELVGRTTTDLELGQTNPTLTSDRPAAIESDVAVDSAARVVIPDAAGIGRSEEPASQLPSVASGLSAFQDSRSATALSTTTGRDETRSLDRPFGFQTPSLLVPFLSPSADDASASEYSLMPWWQIPTPPETPLTRSNRPRSSGWFDTPPPDRLPSDRIEAAIEPTAAPAFALVTTLQVVAPTADGLGATVSKTADPATRPSVQRVATLEQALASLGRYPNVRKIELQFNGVQKVPPIQIPPSNLREIQAAAGYRPGLQFSQDFLMSPTAPPQLLLESGQLEISGIDFFWATAPESGADFLPRLIEVPLLSRLAFKDCTFQQSMDDTALTGWVEPRPLPEPPVASAQTSPTWVYTNTLPLTAWEGRKQGILTFERCVFHGRADVFNARAAHATLLRLTDCLVVTSGTVARWGERGNRVRSTGIEMEIERSTIIAAQGVLQTQAEGAAPAAPVNLFAHDSLFATTDASRGLLHHTNLANDATLALNEGPRNSIGRSDRDRPADWLFFDGFNNTLLTMRIWSEGDRDGGQLINSVDFDQALGSRWFRHDLVNHRPLNQFERNHLLTKVLPTPLTTVSFESLSAVFGLESAGLGVNPRVLPVLQNRPPISRSP